MVCILIFTFGQLAFLTPWAQQQFALSVGWWASSVLPTPDDDSSDEGMFLLTSPAPFFAIFAVVPLVVSTILYECFVRKQRATYWRPSSLVWKMSTWLRRKPRVFGWLSWFSIGDSLFLAVILIAGNLVVVWYGVQSQHERVERHFGRGSLNSALGITGIVFGYSCMFNMGFLFLPAARNLPWLEFVNVSYANGVKYHRWLGVATLIALALHVLPFYWLWYRQGRLLQLSLPCFSCSLEYMSPGYAAWMVVFGEISTLLLIGIGITSIPSIRRKNYELFAKGHRLTGLSLLFAVLHWAPTLWWILPAMGLLYLSRVKQILAVLGPPPQVDEYVVLPDGIIKIVVSRPPNHRGGEYKLGQFVYLNAPSLDKEQLHPITIASSPRTKGSSFTLLIKVLGDWTQDLAEYIEACAIASPRQQPDIRVDGFYGSSLQIYECYPVVCLVGGGIGATPLFAILEDMLISTLRGERMPRRVTFVFAFRELSLLEEIHPILERLKQVDPQGKTFSIYLNMTRFPNDSVLDQPACRSNPRLTTEDDKGAEHDQPQRLPFTAALATTRYRIIAYLFLFAGMTAVIFWLEAGGGLLTGRPGSSRWWPLQRILEVFSMGFVARMLSVVISMEKRALARRELVSAASALNQSDDIPRETSAVTTYRELLALHKVAHGRPDMTAIMSKVHGGLCHCLDSARDEASAVGVFVSGPESLKRETERVCSDLSSNLFDIHEEEFEL